MEEPTDISIATSDTPKDSTSVQVFVENSVNDDGDSWTTTLDNSGPPSLMSSSIGECSTSISCSLQENCSDSGKRINGNISQSKAQEIINEILSSSSSGRSNKTSYSQKSIHDSDTIFDQDLFTEISFQRVSDVSIRSYQIISEPVLQKKTKLGFKVGARSRAKRKSSNDNWSAILRKINSGELGSARSSERESER